ncbi:hypothetical protein [Gimesia fumaroli]|uniref:Uncharacterized protein n=1 Tax=Gimesia fumaroli TaxID=2527976 RepID=A0A518ILR9_9PLAN|nr:hypothetical protein [Gimesia fumaroli]QDV53995.1 hypothetical protein Enr17x_60780 [Gimesia fumaroli]
MNIFNLKQQRGRTWLAGILVLLLAYRLTVNYQPPLSVVEQQLVGEWIGTPPGLSRIFKPDRTFLTSNGQFAGVWRIEEGVLTVTAHQPYELPRSLSLNSLSLSFDSFQRSFTQETYQWQIEFSDDGKQHTLNHPVDKQHPDGKWHWHRKQNKTSERPDAIHR